MIERCIHLNVQRPFLCLLSIPYVPVDTEPLEIQAACLYLYLCTLWVYRNSHLGGMTPNTSRPTIGYFWSDLAECVPLLAGDPVAACPNPWRCCWDGVTACCCQSKCQGAASGGRGAPCPAGCLRASPCLTPSYPAIHLCQTSTLPVLAWPLPWV